MGPRRVSVVDKRAAIMAAMSAVDDRDEGLELEEIMGLVNEAAMEILQECGYDEDKAQSATDDIQGLVDLDSIIHCFLCLSHSTNDLWGWIPNKGGKRICGRCKASGNRVAISIDAVGCDVTDCSRCYRDEPERRPDVKHKRTKPWSKK
jgi:hypothetical protein